MTYAHCPRSTGQKAKTRSLRLAQMVLPEDGGPDTEAQILLCSDLCLFTVPYLDHCERRCLC